MIDQKQIGISAAVEFGDDIAADETGGSRHDDGVMCVHDYFSPP
jgi:hypothetical protein